MRLIGMTTSPWTERARWALDHHGLSYEYVPHVPLMGEPALRMSARRFDKATAPLLVDGKRRVMGSIEIARYADRAGKEGTLFPAGHDPEIEDWDRESEAALCAARALTLARMAVSRGAQAESLPSFVPDALRGVLAPGSRLGIAWVQRKYAAGEEATREASRVLVAALERLERALGERRYLLGTFSFADIAMSAIVAGVRPVSLELAPHITIGPAVRACWGDPELEARFPRLLEWRDALYRDHRSARARRSEDGVERSASVE